MTISAAGMQRVAYQHAQSAKDVVSATTTDVGNAASDGKLEKAMVAQATDPARYQANATAFNTADAMSGALLDVLA